ncbi:MAG TPA: transketolase [Thermoleophilaceae bacterium]|nr:transketolase [Thermoleophilaceae bacterium]
MDRNDFRRELAQQLRVDSIRSSDAGGSGHPTSSMSAADLMAVLLDGHLRLDFDNPANPAGDHLVFSKGHASPLLYSCFKAAGAISDEELLSFRRLGSRFEGHPTPVLPWVDVATGSLGQGLPVAAGLALAAKRLDRTPSRVWCLCGDSEMAEGSIWEAFDHASHWELDNLVAIVDVNRLGQTGETMHGWNLDLYAARARAFGWDAIEVDGHDVDAIEEAYAQAERTSGRPAVVLARTRKGAGVKAVEDQPGKHGKPIEDAEEAIAELGGERELTVELAKPEAGAEAHRFDAPGGDLPRYELGEEVATRKAYGEALKALGDARGDVVALDGEVSNSTYSEIFRDAHPDRYVEVYIAEQQLVATAVALQRRGWKPFGSTFAAFFTRAYDFVRMAAVSRAELKLCGSHAGVSIGEDGPSQMGLEDLAAFRAVHGSTVLYPSDANQAARLVELMADLDGVAYLRTHRGAMPVIYGPDEEFEAGGSRVVRDGDDITLVGAGVTLHEALGAAEELARDGVEARVIDLYSVKPVDVQTLARAAAETGAIVTAEDHWPEGGLGEAVLSALADSGENCRVRKLGVEIMPGSGTPEELLREAGIDAGAIAAAARQLVGARATA